MKALKEIIEIMKPSFSLESINRFSQLRSNTQMVREIISAEYAISDEEINFVRFHFLDLIDVVCGDRSNSAWVCRDSSDSQIFATLKSLVVVDPSDRYDLLKSLRSVGNRSAICVLSFFYPQEYGIANKSSLTFLRLLNPNFGKAPIPEDIVYSRMISELSKQFNYETALDFSVDLLAAAEYIMTRRFRRMPTQLLFEEKFEFKLKAILNELEIIPA